VNVTGGLHETTFVALYVGAERRREDMFQTTSGTSMSLPNGHKPLDLIELQITLYEETEVAI
jgi:hypothetical protein